MINTTKYTTVANMSHLRELRHSVSKLHPINSELNEDYPSVCDEDAEHGHEDSGGAER